MAIGLAQSLGWHRKSSLTGDDEGQKNRKMMVFWFLYIIDKGLSLRLGRASNMQDYDIDMPLPGPQFTPVTGKFSSMFQRWVGEARIQGLVYEKLYSPSSLNQTLAVRAQIVKELVEEAKSVRLRYLNVRINPCLFTIFLH
jgi:hypothetical protein